MILVIGAKTWCEDTFLEQLAWEQALPAGQGTHPPQKMFAAYNKKLGTHDISVQLVFNGEE